MPRAGSAQESNPTASKPFVESRKARGPAEQALEAPHVRESRWQVQRRRRKRVQAILPVAAAAVVVALVAVVSATGGFPTLFPPPAPGSVPMHIHPRLAIFNGQTQVNLPTDIGIDDSMYADHSLDSFSEMAGMAPLHTHDSSGVIHVESKVTRDYTLGEFFAIWGQPLGPDQTLSMRADASHYLVMVVDGQTYLGTDWGALVFKNEQQIEIHYEQI